MNADGTVNVAPFSWVTPVSMDPPMMALALGTLRKKQHTLTNIEREGEFVVNLPEIRAGRAAHTRRLQLSGGAGQVHGGRLHAAPLKSCAASWCG